MTMDETMSDSHDVSVRVRYAETDRMGLLHHANYFVYFEMARTEMLRAAGAFVPRDRGQRALARDHRHRLQVQTAGAVR